MLKTLTPHATINLNGGTALESNLAISSDNTIESGVSVTNGGNLTLNDSTIVKTAPAGSKAGAPLYPNQAPDTPGQSGPPGGPPPGSQAGVDPGAGGGDGSGDIGSKSSGVYAGSKGNAILSNITIDTNLEEGKGLCAVGKGSSITMIKGAIATAGRSSHGVYATRGGAVSLKDVSITTKGEHSSTIATDGEGEIIVEGGTYTALGKYSAGIYSTKDISIFDATFKSEADNVAVMEWASKITLTNTSLWSGKKGAVMVHQTMSMDVPSGTEYKMTGGAIKAEEGPIFYVTNTTATIDLKNVQLSGASGTLLKAIKGDWGTDISWAKPTQGGTVTFVADEQTLPGDIVIDEYSSITATLKNKSKLKGAINANNKGKEMNLMLDASSIWDVTADSYLNALILSGGVSGDSVSNIIGNGHTVYYNKNASSSALGGKTYNLAKGGKLQPK